MFFNRILILIFNLQRAGLSYLEVALLIRQSGGTYSYWYEAYGRIPAFLICWFWSVIGKSSNFYSRISFNTVYYRQTIFRLHWCTAKRPS